MHWMEFLDGGGKPSEDQARRWIELQEQMQHHTALTAEIAQTEAAERAARE